MNQGVWQLLRDLHRLDARPAYDLDELSWLYELVKAQRPESMLEIGSRYGGTLYVLAHAMPKGARIVSIDLPGGLWGDKRGAKVLPEICNEIEAHGYEVDLYIGDSKSREIMETVHTLFFQRPVGFLHLDGDHRYASVKADFENYFPMVAPWGFCALHDVWPRAEQPEIEVPRLWAELVAAYGKATTRFVSRATSPGVGIVWKTNQRESER